MKKKLKILDIEIDTLTQKEVLDQIKLFLTSKEKCQIVTLNSEMILNSEKDANFKQILKKADLIVADGAGVINLANFEKQKSGSFLHDFLLIVSLTLKCFIKPSKNQNSTLERIGGIDLMQEMLKDEHISSQRIYLFGAEEGVAQKAKKNILKNNRTANIIGAEEGVRKDNNKKEKEEIIKNINNEKADIVFVALGSPKQEKWIYDNFDKLETVKIAIGVGGSFDFLSGKIKRAPKLWQKHSLEWLWRLIQEPKRIKRIYNATIGVSWLIFRKRKVNMVYEQDK